MNVNIPVYPHLPERLSHLATLAYDLWWSWHPPARDLFRRLDRTLWRETQHNPVRMLQDIDHGHILARSENARFLALYDSVVKQHEEYINSPNTWFSQTFPERHEQIAYFCAEFGIHNSLPIYSGGLGILAGDTCKEASDLGIPMIGIGALYPEGYFHQRMEADGRQEAVYARLEVDSVPILPVVDADGKQLLVTVPMGHSEVKVAVWRVRVGRVPIYLMDTDIEENELWLRDVSARLYGGDQNVRLRQEIILGMGGLRVLRALGFAPTCFHLNEGHAAFAGLELIREKCLDGHSFEVALGMVQKELVFTTHTPVKAGHDEFSFDRMEEYFQPFWWDLGLQREKVLELGQADSKQSFSMTILAMRIARKTNGVSRKHGEVTQEMWGFLWGDKQHNRIVSITNGVHVPTWVSPHIIELIDRELGPYWLETHDDPALWERVLRIPDEELWRTHLRLKRRLLTFIRQRARKKWLREGASADQMVALGTLLDPEVLTIGFARRFATYKRATLILEDLERLKQILKNEWRPVQFIFSGKAHPADEPGKYFLQKIFQAAGSHDLEGRLAFVEDYDKHVAHYLVTGVDIWMNNPQLPLEASGTSGQKAAMNGVPNFSVLDGWWYEGFNERNGWAIEGEDDAETANNVYETLEKTIIPLYYERDSQQIPRGWLALMKESMRSSGGPFSARRMMIQYAREMYIEFEQPTLRPAMSTTE